MLIRRFPRFDEQVAVDQIELKRRAARGDKRRNQRRNERLGTVGGQLRQRDLGAEGIGIIGKVDRLHGAKDVGGRALDEFAGRAAARQRRKGAPAVRRGDGLMSQRPENIMRVERGQIVAASAVLVEHAALISIERRDVLQHARAERVDVIVSRAVFGNALGDEAPLGLVSLKVGSAQRHERLERHIAPLVHQRFDCIERIDQRRRREQRNCGRGVLCAARRRVPGRFKAAGHCRRQQRQRVVFAPQPLVFVLERHNAQYKAFDRLERVDVEGLERLRAARLHGVQQQPRKVDPCVGARADLGVLKRNLMAAAAHIGARILNRLAAFHARGDDRIVVLHDQHGNARRLHRGDLLEIRLRMRPRHAAVDLCVDVSPLEHRFEQRARHAVIAGRSVQMAAADFDGGGRFEKAAPHLKARVGVCQQHMKQRLRVLVRHASGGDIRGVIRLQQPVEMAEYAHADALERADRLAAEHNRRERLVKRAGALCGHAPGGFSDAQIVSARFVRIRFGRQTARLVRKPRCQTHERAHGRNRSAQKGAAFRVLRPFKRGLRPGGQPLETD